MKKLLLLLLIFFCNACAETPDGWIVMNEETIENFFDKSKKSWAPAMSLNLERNQQITAAEIPPPGPGLVRVEGTLTSNGQYAFPGSSIEKRGSTFSHSIFGMLGPAGENGNAWFYADIDPSSGTILGGRAYLYGFMGGVCDLREKFGMDFGQVTNDKMAFSIAGYCLFPQISGSAMEYALLVEGKFPGYDASSRFPVSYIMDGTGTITAIPGDPRKNPAIFDSGDGLARIMSEP